MTKLIDIVRVFWKFRKDVMDAYLFRNIQEVKASAFECQVEYNKNHPHK